jgi:hypothetical protein
MIVHPVVATHHHDLIGAWGNIQHGDLLSGPDVDRSLSAVRLCEHDDGVSTSVVFHDALRRTGNTGAQLDRMSGNAGCALVTGMIL